MYNIDYLYKYTHTLLTLSRTSKIQAKLFKRTTCCSLFGNNLAKKRYMNPPLAVAKANGLLRGLQSYNIFRNPQYCRAMAVDLSFGDRHRNISSAHNLSKGVLPMLSVDARDKAFVKKRRGKKK